MSYEFTKLSGVPAVAEFPEGANAIIEINGEIKRCPSSGGGVQPDWNQNDDTQPDYVKNRPFYTGDPVETVLVEESTVSFTAEGSLYKGRLESTFSATVGETYKVSWDGTTYECACVEDSGTTSIGNLSIVGAGTDTGEPFIMSVNNGIALEIYTADTAASHTISISRVVAQVVKIDEKYLPDNLATKSEVEVAQTAAADAQTTAEKNKEVLTGAFSSVARFTFDKQTSDRDTLLLNPFDYYKISDFNPAPSDVVSFRGTVEAGGESSKITAGNNCVGYGPFIIVAAAGVGSIPITTADGVVEQWFNAPSAGLYAQYGENNTNMTAGTGEFTLLSYGLTIKSSTYGSTKQFKITVDDSGTISATEVT